MKTERPDCRLLDRFADSRCLACGRRLHPRDGDALTCRGCRAPITDDLIAERHEARENRRAAANHGPSVR